MGRIHEEANVYRFHAQYSEQRRLPNGTQVLVRVLGPEDAPHLRAVFEGASPESRYFRFFGTKRELTEAEARRLASMDGLRRFALGAFVLDAAGAVGPMMGVARFEHHLVDRAEGAALVRDAYQGMGVGTLLFQRLGAAAEERGIAELEFTTLASNRGLIATVRRAFPRVGLECPEPGVLNLVAYLAPIHTPAPQVRAG